MDSSKRCTAAEVTVSTFSVRAGNGGRVYARTRRDQAKRRTKAGAERMRADFLTAVRRKNISLSDRQEEMHQSSAGFPQGELFENVVLLNLPAQAFVRGGIRRAGSLRRTRRRRG